MESPPPNNDPTRVPNEDEDPYLDDPLLDDEFADDEVFVGETAGDEEPVIVEPEPATERRRWSPFALGAFALAALAGVMALAAAFGTQWDLWDFRAGFQLLDWSMYVALAAGAVAIIAMLITRGSARRRGFYLAAIALVLALVLAFVPWNWRRSLASGPPIHDISTDLENPPEFAAVIQRRGPGDLPVQHGGPEVAQHQRRAFPNIRPLIIDLPRDRAFQRAYDAAESMGWNIIAASETAGRIEAIDQTTWFGFEDDIVIRLTPLEGRTIVDVRALARQPRGDSRAIAERLRTYLDRVDG